MKHLATLAALLLAATPALAAEEAVTLKPGPGIAAIQQNCSGCHSLDYVQMNSPFLSPDAWKAEIGKMRAAYGAAIDDEDAATIHRYLSENYGPPK